MTESLPSTRYANGKPCKHGHVEARITSSGSCTVCRRAIEATMKAKRVPHVFKGRDMDNARRLQREHYTANRDAYIARASDWRTNNADKRRAIANKWVRDNPRKALAAVRKRQAAKLRRTPAWADLAAIADFYRDCPCGYVVDHVIPLRGKLVSGLHVLNNLQYLLNIDNMLKSNKFDPWTFET
jgi:hypothetical protein